MRKKKNSSHIYAAGGFKIYIAGYIYIVSSALVMKRNISGVCVYDGDEGKREVRIGTLVGGGFG